MQLIDQNTKKIMEGCKERARSFGLDVPNETLEYIVTNRDMINLSPKVMIPTLYNYWVNDVEVLKESGRYKLYPSNPYETVINTRPPISFYNDNNPDWLNIMIFYHVIAHIDFFRNNILFQNTWSDDFVGKALADKRLIESFRSKYGRWVDYIIEFARSIDNITGYFKSLPKLNLTKEQEPGDKMEYFINVFLPEVVNATEVEVIKYIEKYNLLIESEKDTAERLFFADIKSSFPEFDALFESYNVYPDSEVDIMEFISEYSPFLNKRENQWMKSVVAVIRETSLYFAPQMRTKIMNEGWASYWHDKLFISDDRIKGFETQYAKINSGVTSISRVGLNPYAIGLRMFYHIEEMADKGKFYYDFQKLTDRDKRNDFNRNLGNGMQTIFEIRKNFTDFNFINIFTSQDFVDRYNLFVVGKRLDEERGVYQYYIKSRKAEDYKQMLIDSMYHPPVIKVNHDKTNDENLYLVHEFEGKQLYKPYIADTLIGLEFLWGDQVVLETTEIRIDEENSDENETKFVYDKVLYAVKDRKVTKTKL
ncbi:MAG TPA: SpoVR family protein [Bacteroidales bacterium]|nr:SpoVR family protein [Bacteroidales bacterium]